MRGLLTCHISPLQNALFTNDVHGKPNINHSKASLVISDGIPSVIVFWIAASHPEWAVIKTPLSRVLKNVIVGAYFENEITLMIGSNVYNDRDKRALLVGLGDDSSGIEATRGFMLPGQLVPRIPANTTQTPIGSMLDAVSTTVILIVILPRTQMDLGLNEKNGWSYRCPLALGTPPATWRLSKEAPLIEHVAGSASIALTTRPLETTRSSY